VATRCNIYALYKLRANELDEAFLETVESQFGEREIEVAVCEATDVQEDETAYLLRSPANRERVLEALRNIEQGRNLVTLEVEDLR
jgi:antitoxin YefM